MVGKLFPFFLNLPLVTFWLSPVTKLARISIHVCKIVQYARDSKQGEQGVRYHKAITLKL